MTPGIQEAESEEQIRTFAERAIESAAMVHRLTADGTHQLLVAHQHIVASPEAEARYKSLLGRVRDSGCKVVVASGRDRVQDIEVGLAVGELAIAETGSVLVNEARLEDRRVALFAKHLLLIVQTQTVLPSLDDAASWLEARSGRPSYSCLITGPSRTADIERSLTIGVQGAHRVDVILLS